MYITCTIINNEILTCSNGILSFNKKTIKTPLIKQIFKWYDDYVILYTGYDISIFNVATFDFTSNFIKVEYFNEFCISAKEFCFYSKFGLFLCFLYKNTLFYKNLFENYGNLVYGEIDFVSEEEFSIKSHFWLNKENLIFIKIDYSDVCNYEFGEEVIKYPFALSKNPKKSLNLIKNVKNFKEIICLDFIFEKLLFKVEYILNCLWVSDFEFCLSVLNRQQNEFSILRVNLINFAVEVLYYEKSKTWIRVTHLLHFTSRDEFIVSKIIENKLQLINNKEINLVPFNVEIYNQSKLHQIKEVLFFTGRFIDNPLEFTLFYVNLVTLECNALFDTGFTFICEDWISEDVCLISRKNIISHVSYFIAKIEITEKPSYTVLSDYSDSSSVPFDCRFKSIDSISFNPSNYPSNNKVPLLFTENNIHEILLLPTSKPSSLVVSIYCGPSSNHLRNSTSIYGSLEQSLVNSVILQIEGKNSNLNGYGAEDGFFRNFNSDDVLYMTKRVLDKFKAENVVFKSVVLYGCSFGGYVALKTIANNDSKEIFTHCFACFSPFSFLLYDTGYSERYLGLDHRGYKESEFSDLELCRLREFGRERYLCLVHGQMDDNVLFVNFEMFRRSLENAERFETVDEEEGESKEKSKGVDFVVYDEGHGLFKENNRRHFNELFLSKITNK